MRQTTLDCRAMLVAECSKMPRHLPLSTCVLPYASSCTPFSIDLCCNSLQHPTASQGSRQA